MASASTTRQTPAPLEHMTLGATNRFAESFYARRVREGDMLLDTPYQRGSVWTLDQNIALICSWLRGLPIPAVIINDRAAAGWDCEADDFATYAVIDGKQRILTAISWFSSWFAVPASWFPAEHVERTEETADGPYVRYSGLTRSGQLRMENRCVLPCAEARLPSVEAEAEVYLLVNGGGTPQTAQDMAKATEVAGGSA